MFPKKIITREDGTPYLIRTYLIKTKLFQVVIHKILQSDYDCLHDHPWNFLSIILKGGYWEGTTPEQVIKGNELLFFQQKYGRAIYYRWFGPGSILYRRAEWKHSLKLEDENKFIIRNSVVNKPKPATTLVIMFKRRREWGFFTKLQGWVPWYKYDSKQNCE